MAINSTGNSCRIDRSCVVGSILRFSRKFQTSRDMIINFHITSFSSNRLKYMRPRYYEDSREFERTGWFLPRTIRKSCKLGENLSQESREELGQCLRELLAVRNALQKFDPARLLDESLLLVFLRTQRKSILSKKRGTFVCAPRSRSSLRNSHGIVTFLGGFQRHGTMINDAIYERDKAKKRANGQTI